MIILNILFEDDGVKNGVGICKLGLCLYFFCNVIILDGLKNKFVYFK